MTQHRWPTLLFIYGCVINHDQTTRDREWESETIKSSHTMRNNNFDWFQMNFSSPIKINFVIWHMNTLSCEMFLTMRTTYLILFLSPFGWPMYGHFNLCSHQTFQNEMKMSVIGRWRKWFRVRVPMGNWLVNVTLFEWQSIRTMKNRIERLFLPSQVRVRRVNVRHRMLLLET